MDFDLKGVHPLIAMPTNRAIPHETVLSLLKTAGDFQRRGVPLSIDLQDGASLVHHARTRCANYFLETDCTHLFWVDSDMEWQPEDFLRFVALATKFECVVGTYRRKADKSDFYIDYLSKTIKGNEYGLVPIRGCGLGFTVVQRKVIQQIADKSPKLKFSTTDKPVPRIFRCDDIDGQARGEDHAFFADVRELGYQVMLDPTITLGHIGMKNYSGSAMECMGPKEVAA